MPPEAPFPEEFPDEPQALDNWLQQFEERAGNVKALARASVVWADPANKAKTDYALVYLHGFKASHPEGDPIHKNIARHFGWNLYLSRLEGHGLNIDRPLAHLQPYSLIRSALMALAVGTKIGNKIILMGTSTGGSLSLYLAGKSNCKPLIEGLLLYSPLIQFYSYNQWLLGSRIGRGLLKTVPGKRYMLKSEPGTTTAEDEIWYPAYAMQGALSLGRFIQETMKPNLFSRIKTPAFVGYYYKNRSEQDKVVSVKAIKDMYRELGTPKSQKTLKNYPDAGTHVISSGLLSKSIGKLEKDSLQFLKLHLSVDTN